MPFFIYFGNPYWNHPLLPVATFMQNDLLCGTGRDEMSANKVGSHRHAIRAKLIYNKKVKSFIFCKGTYLPSKINTLLTKIVFFVAVFKTKISFRSVVRY